MLIKNNTSTDDECPIKSPISSSEQEVAFSCCFLAGWLACLFTLPNPHMLIFTAGPPVYFKSARIL